MATEKIKLYSETSVYAELLIPEEFKYLNWSTFFEAVLAWFDDSVSYQWDDRVVPCELSCRPLTPGYMVTARGYIGVCRMRGIVDVSQA